MVGGAVDKYGSEYNDQIQEGISDFIGSLDPHRRTASLASITSREVLKYRDGLVGEGLSESSANLALTVVRSLLSDARRQGIILTNPAEAIAKFKAHDTDARQPFTAQQIKLLYAAADQEWRGMILLGAHGGLRIADAANLRWSSVDVVRRTLSYEPQKTAARRKKHQRTTTIYLHDDLVSYLESIIPSNDNPDTPLFPSLRGVESGGKNGLSALFRAVMQKVGIVAPLGAQKCGRGRQFKALSFHSLRHSFVSSLANAEVPMEVRKEMAGHSSDQIHEGYSHLSIELKKSAVAKLPSVLPA